jgi:hypothetical protein
MKDNRLGGIALTIGAVCGAITMAIHPVTGGHSITPAQFETLAKVLVGVHVLAIAGIPFLFLGALALTRLLDSPSRIAVTALVIYSLSLVAVMIAPAISGLVGTEILWKIAAGGSGGEQWRTLLDYNHMINQAFSGIFVVASSVAIGLWSLRIVQSGALPKAIGIFGMTLGAAVIIAKAFGLRLDAHGFGLIIFGEGIWLIAVGIVLTRVNNANTMVLGATRAPL